MLTTTRQVGQRLERALAAAGTRESTPGPGGLRRFAQASLLVSSRSVNVPEKYSNALCRCQAFTSHFNELYQNIQGIVNGDGTPVGADLSRPPPIYRPLPAIPLSRLIC